MIGVFGRLCDGVWFVCLVLRFLFVVILVFFWFGLLLVCWFGIYLW